MELQVPLKTYVDIDIVVEHFTESIQESVWQSTPMKIKTTTDLPSLIEEKIAEKRKLRKVWHRTHPPQDKTKKIEYIQGVPQRKIIHTVITS